MDELMYLILDIAIYGLTFVLAFVLPIWFGRFMYQKFYPPISPEELIIRQEKRQKELQNNAKFRGDNQTLILKIMGVFIIIIMIIILIIR